MENVREWIAETLMCSADSLPPDPARLVDIEGWDSLKHVGLILGIERKLNRKLTAEQVRGITTLADVRSALEQTPIDA